MAVTSKTLCLVGNSISSYDAEIFEHEMVVAPFFSLLKAGLMFDDSKRKDENEKYLKLAIFERVWSKLLCVQILNKEPG